MLKEREPWQLEQWSGAIQWYLRWLKYQREAGGEVRTLEERVGRAVEGAGARRGLLRRTRETYGRWAAGFARWAGNERDLLKSETASAYLEWLVTERKVSFSTQKQALNALVFFLKDVCGRDEVLFDVRLRKTAKRLPVVLDVAEVMAVLNRMDGCFELMAKIQYGGGLRVNELVNLRVTATGLTPRVRARGAKIGAPSPRKAQKDERAVHFQETAAVVSCPIYERDLLLAGNRIRGPAVVEQADSTIVIPPSFEARVDAHGRLIMTRAPAIRTARA